MADYKVQLPIFHPGQVRAFRATQPSARQLEKDAAFINNAGGQYRAIRCGRRWGKTDYLKSWIGDGAIKGYPTALFAPDYKRMSEVYSELALMLKPITPRQNGANKTDGVIRLITGGRIDFWTLGDEHAGRSRKYKRVGIDESAFTESNMIDIWERAIEPTLLDLRGECVTASNTNGIDPDNFLYRVCNDPKYGFIEVHEPSWNNPYVPGRLRNRTDIEHEADRMAYFANLRERTHPLVYAQEYEAEFVDFSGEALFSIDKWLNDQGKPFPYPTNCDRVFAVIDTAVKSGSEHDGTAIIYFARNQYSGIPLLILDWDIISIDGDLLADWLPNVVMPRLIELSKMVGAREGSRGIFIEDAQSGQVLLMHGARRGWPVIPINSALTSIGKDGRAIAVSSHHYQGKCKITDYAFNKTTQHKNTMRNHLIGQVAGFRLGDKKAFKRSDDLLDAFTYGLALALGDNKGF